MIILIFIFKRFNIIKLIIKLKIIYILIIYKIIIVILNSLIYYIFILLEN